MWSECSPFDASTWIARGSGERPTFQSASAALSTIHCGESELPEDPFVVRLRITDSAIGERHELPKNVF